MKTKLLKKIRNRLSISYYPKGTTIDSNTYTESLILVYDSQKKYTIKIIFIGLSNAPQYYDIFSSTHEHTLKQGKVVAYRELIWYIRREFNKFGVRRNKAEKEKDKAWELKREQDRKTLNKQQKEAEQKLWYNESNR
jgi:hypothetical protein